MKKITKKTKTEKTSAQKKIKSANLSAEKIIKWAESEKIDTCFDRAEKIKPCPIGASGACCKVCHMGPCRFIGEHAETDASGVCGASLSTVAARNLLRMIAAGTAAHSDHARGMAFTLLAVANGEAKDFKITDIKKLHKIAQILGITFEERSVNDVAKDVANKLLEDFFQTKRRS